MEVRGRIPEWNEFNALEIDHIADYTIPQYGDAPNDFMSTTSAHDVEQQIIKYTKRFGSNQRGFNDQQLDLLKIAHYCCILYFKRIKERNNGA